MPRFLISLIVFFVIYLGLDYAAENIENEDLASYFVISGHYFCAVIAYCNWAFLINYIQDVADLAHRDTENDVKEAYNTFD